MSSHCREEHSIWQVSMNLQIPFVRTSSRDYGNHWKACRGTSCKGMDETTLYTFSCTSALTSRPLCSGSRDLLTTLPLHKSNLMSVSSANHMIFHVVYL